MPILGLSTKGPSAPAHFNLESLIRPNILALQPYRCARDDYSSGMLLDANENAIGAALPANFVPGLEAEDVSALNRYPSPTHDELKRRIAKLRNVPDEKWVFLGVGSDEVIDMLYRCLCVPAKDNILTTPPTYGMYGVCAQINDVGIVKVPLVTKNGAYQLDEAAMDAAFVANPDLKMVFICSPGNPTGTLIPLDVIRRVAENTKFKGLVVVDEAYVDFAPEGTSACSLVTQYANVCVMQTLSKSFGLASIRLGFLVGSPELVQILTNAKAPYNVSLPTAAIGLQAFSEEGLAIMAANVRVLNANRDALIAEITQIPNIGRVLGGNHANFIVVEILKDGKPDTPRAKAVYTEMAENRGVVVRFRGSEIGCEGCLRITVGTEDENKTLLARLRELLV
ncbi:hypothetical protein CcaverHIS002_0601510 [Cutaneotrichosporon cavernicola]|uniref:histidinol-phosphate transaminase n=1 Tax=Cutaneotrichosporon cavernicola TaxID=279322 RepID=A0AA48L5Z3_9TREE|nr:uncharacterized protein CcaverHIS019_0501610 [Cutaneotrichosporon cavernicola]BEI85864.1 hypothetical protein CcaverHIS002_0601510 [Cutaneotrichosporon cavernicola]BEI92533.1 hypothetical protein CcaverHIS019_0501610 [Cutaneotrichosporon cavernicola]BEJ00306.1 hypothetical protein CcaverHIS631_0501630 [Cutaneotrichosporon cavernicola]BEJ08076.1 hypothetical protein CcaverHIS641_0501610 [Cutaneotrichosporon cavernicola]